MGLRALVTRWIEQWAEHELDARMETRLRAWAGADLKEHIGAHFDAEFRERFDALPKADLKELLDAYFDARANDFIEEKFDARFFTWADLWADKNLRPRLDAHFDARLSGRIDTLVQARAANLINDYIDRRIRQHLAVFSASAAAGREPVADRPRPAGEEAATPSRPDESDLPGTLVTAAQLARLLSEAQIKTGRIRAVLKGHEAIPGRTNKYRLGDAAARVLLRKRRETLGRRNRGRKRSPGPKG